MKYYNLNISEVYDELDSCSDGIDNNEATKRIEQYGLNVLKEGKKKSKLNRFFDQFKDLMIIILIITAVFMFIYGFLYSHEYTDVIVIVVVVLLNAIMGFIQEEKAEVTLEGLKQYSVTNTTVKRNGELKIIDSRYLVPGDIIKLQSGDTVPADARLIDSSNLYVDESALTGESTTIEKKSDKLNDFVQIQDQNNMLFSGSNITMGNATAIVVRTGMNTEIGSIANSLNTPYEIETPLEKQIKELSKNITMLIFLILLFIFFYSIIRGNNLVKTIMLCTSLAVAAIPEGLPAVITITLSNGVYALSKKKAIVRQMRAVETLGSINVICSDKTGTITKNKMTIKRSLIYDNKMLFNIFALCNDTVISDDKMIGDPTEICLYDYLIDNKKNPLSMRKKYKRIIDAPFDSDRKMMSSINEIDGDKYILVKGSFENIIARCSYTFENGKRNKLTKEAKNKIVDMCEEYQKEALRVMGYAYKKVSKVPKTVKEVLKEEDKLVLAGIVGIIDPPRDSVKESVEECIKASIRPIMITGDSLITACAIAKEVGIIKDFSEGILGEEFDKYNDDELCEVVKKYSVYARVSPIHKERIVHALEKLDMVVAMTGDGVNDAPAIKDAHVGVGMGITGTEVTKSVADVVLLDDSFSTIVTAVGEGRRIYTNIRNNIVYSLSSNIAEILIVIIGMLTNQVILLPIHILFIDLITDSIPSIALSFEKSPSNIMNEKPKGIKKPLFTPFILSWIVVSAILETSVALFVYFNTYKQLGSNVASTLALLSIVLQEIIFSISCRNLKTIIYKHGIFSNRIMNLSIILVIVVQILFFLTPLGDLVYISKFPIFVGVIVILVNIFVLVLYESLKGVLTKVFSD